MTEEDVNYIRDLQEIHPQLGNDSATVRFLISEYQKMKAKQEKENREKINTTILKSVDSNLRVLMDVANTMLIEEKLEYCIPIRHQESPVVAMARDSEKEFLANLKQQKDYNNRKKGTENNK